MVRKHSLTFPSVLNVSSSDRKASIDNMREALGMITSDP